MTEQCRFVSRLGPGPSAAVPACIGSAGGLCHGEWGDRVWEKRPDTFPGPEPGQRISTRKDAQSCRRRNRADHSPRIRPGLLIC